MEDWHRANLWPISYPRAFRRASHLMETNSFLTLLCTCLFLSTFVILDINRSSLRYQKRHSLANRIFRKTFCSNLILLAISLQMLSMSPEPTDNVFAQQPAPAQSLPSNMTPNTSVPNGLTPTPIVPSAPAMQALPQQAQQMLPQMQPKPVQLPQPQASNTDYIINPKLVGNAPTSSAAVGAAPGTIRNGNGGGQLLQFPWKLHEMLHLAEKNGKTAIISWLPGGNGFKVHDKENFCSEIMPGYFASQKYKTFQRSLNLWGFESVAKGPDRGACYHQYFVKGHPELCHNM